MFGFFKKMCGCEGRKEKAIKQDKAVREDMSERQIDKQLKDTMEASDPVAKY